MLVEIYNIQDDIERKVVRVAFIKNDPRFTFQNITQYGIPSIGDLYDTTQGFVMLPIEGNLSFSENINTTDAGKYTENSISFDVLMQEEKEEKTIASYSAKKGIMIMETSMYRYMIGNYEEPIQFTHNSDVSKLQISVRGDSRRKNLRQKISPF